MSIFARRRKVRLSRHRTAAGPFGPIRISYDRWPSVIAHVDGTGIPTATVLPGPRLSVAGQRVHTDQGGPWWDPRRRARTSFAQVGDRRYELRPTGLVRARLLRDGVAIAHGRGTLRAYFSPVRTIAGIDARLTWSAGADPTDVAAGHAMVLAFGAGAPGVLTWLLTIWLQFQ